MSGDYDPVRDNERSRTLTDDEICVLGKLVPAARLPRSIESVVWVMLACGTRVGETLVTRWADLDFKARTWTIPKERTKSSAEIAIHLSDFVLAQFAAQQVVRAGLPEGDARREYVFPSQQGKIPHVTIHTTCKAIRDRQRGKGVRQISYRRATPPQSVFQCNSDVTIRSRLSAVHAGSREPHPLSASMPLRSPARSGRCWKTPRCSQRCCLSARSVRRSGRSGA